MPVIKIIKDYDGYFEKLVSGFVRRKKGEFKHKIIEVEAMPWLTSACQFVRDGDTIKLTFYSALRSGFGSLSASEEEQIIDLL